MIKVVGLFIGSILKTIWLYRKPFLLGIKMFIDSIWNINQRNELEIIISELNKIFLSSKDVCFIAEIPKKIIIDDNIQHRIELRFNLIITHYSSLKSIIESGIYNTRISILMATGIFIETESIFSDCYKNKPWNKGNFSSIEQKNPIDNFINIYDDNKLKLRSLYKTYFKIDDNRLATSTFTKELNVWLHSDD